MIETFINQLNIPDNCKLNKPVFKKLFLENGKLDATDKKALKDDIDKIRWLYTLKPSTINIAPYKDDVREYDEIAVLQVELLNVGRENRIASFIHKTIPYPLILIFTHKNQLLLSLADKRINQVDKSKWLVEEIWDTAWIDLNDATKAQGAFITSCAINNLSFKNFYAFYEDMKARIIALNAGAHKDNFDLGTKERTELQLKDLRAIDELECKAAELRSRLKKENQFNRKLELNVKIKNVDAAIASLQEQL